MSEAQAVQSVCVPNSVCTPDYDMPVKEVLCQMFVDIRAGMAESVILGWDVETMKKFMVQKGIYTVEEIDAAELEYKRWLNLNIMYQPLSVPISEKIDAFWHVHILFTQDYTAMSYAATGSYIHHRPSILDDANELKMAFVGNTLDLYRKHYGEPNPVFWDNVMCTCQIGD